MKTAREFQIEFERRVLLINPDLRVKEKLTSDTIFAFLNAATERFVKLAYIQGDNVADNTRAQKKNADAIKGLIVRCSLSTKQQDNNNTDQLTDKFELPNDFFFYIRSNSVITSSYKNVDDESKKITPNKTIREDDVEKILSTYYNKIILRNPYVVLNAGEASDTSETTYLNVIHDTYTAVSSVDLVYCRKPKKFNVIGVDDKDVLNHCELPENVHMDIVELAVEMFITETKYRLNVKQSNQQ